MDKPICKIETYDTSLVVLAPREGYKIEAIGIATDISTAEEIIRDHRARFEHFAEVPEEYFAIVSVPVYQKATPLSAFHLGSK